LARKVPIHRKCILCLICVSKPARGSPDRAASFHTRAVILKYRARAVILKYRAFFYYDPTVIL
jgi:hypothetical protein